MKKILFMHGGGPTAVINASLAGSLMELKQRGIKGGILASRFGTGGLLNKDIIEIPELSDDDLYMLSRTPGSAIGTGRDHLESEDYERLADNLEELGVGFVVLTGGNGTMDTARKLAKCCKERGIIVTGTPKTMDNDLSLTDHSPGFPSAARYLAGSVREACQDVRSLPIHIVVIEAFGRDAGWVAASSALAKSKENRCPEMILLPEVAFDEDKFLDRAESLFKRNGGFVIVASEGLRYKSGKPIVEPVFQVGRSTYFGDVSSHLALLITRKLGIKSRSEKPGILGRSSIMWQSELDRKEAIEAGRLSVICALEGKSGYMSIIKRESSNPYSSTVLAHEISDEILQARVMPDEYIDNDGFGVTDAFLEYAKPLVGEDLGTFKSFV